MRSECCGTDGRRLSCNNRRTDIRGGLSGAAALLLAAGLTSAPLHAEVTPTVVYNAVTLLERITLTPTMPFGDDVTFNPIAPGVDPLLTQFQVRYSTSAGFQESESKTVSLRLHLLDGDPSALSFGEATPGTVLYEGASPISTGGSSVFDLTAGGGPIPAPGRIAWSVMLTGLDEGESVNWYLASPFLPGGIGDSDLTYWREVDGVWGLFQVANGLIAGTFSAQALAIPEPGVLSLLTVGGIILLLARRRRNG